MTLTPEQKPLLIEGKRKRRVIHRLFRKGYRHLPRLEPVGFESRPEAYDKPLRQKPNSHLLMENMKLWGKAL